MDIPNQEKQFNALPEQEPVSSSPEGGAEVLAGSENHIPAPEQTQPAEQQISPDTITANPDVEIHQKIEHLTPLPKEEQLWQLKLIARDGSLEKAIAIAKKLNDSWLEDKFHDDLIDDPELRAQLEAMGKLEKL